ncbi:hypothetical protein HMPREF2531_05235 [Bacteroides intestinalis]|uniref:Putative zinc ribbon domain-containing protein n=1 Tax=Bacteroides intestinalis TaxID=329854 RepID=A0A139KNF5_9BACE|nr:hypothetical protein HMPREF2531_05235 [Bacteroides intestinalis]
MEEMYCQSCGMPLVKVEDFATNKDGTPMSEYCIYCFKDGAFTGGYQYGGYDQYQPEAYEGTLQR